MVVLCILCIVSCSVVFTFYCYVMHCCTVYGQSVEGLHGLRHDQTLKSEVFLTNSKGIRAPLAPACPPGKGQGGSCPPCPREYANEHVTRPQQQLTFSFASIVRPYITGRRSHTRTCARSYYFINIFDSLMDSDTRA